LLIKILNRIMEKVLQASYYAWLIITFFPLCFLTLWWYEIFLSGTEEITKWSFWVSIASVLLLAIMGGFCRFYASKIYTVNKDLRDKVKTSQASQDIHKEEVIGMQLEVKCAGNHRQEAENHLRDANACAEKAQHALKRKEWNWRRPQPARWFVLLVLR
jgi:hypothetical protein